MEVGIHTCQGLSQSNPIGITPHHAPTIAPTTGYSRARSVSVRGLFMDKSTESGESVNSLELGEYSNPREPQHDVRFFVLEHPNG